MGKEKEKLKVRREVSRFGGAHSPHIQAQMGSLLRAGAVFYSPLTPFPGYCIDPHRKQVCCQSSLVETQTQPPVPGLGSQNSCESHEAPPPLPPRPC